MESIITLIDKNNEEQMHQMLAIRQEVFVIEQRVPPEVEYDEFEEQSYFYLATLNGNPAGTARWRFTGKGIKLERFAVLKVFRGRGVGSALLGAILEEISRRPDASDQLLYLHAQTHAMPLYEKYGFRPKGQSFMEAGIAHFLMVLPAREGEGH